MTRYVPVGDGTLVTIGVGAGALERMGAGAGALVPSDGAGAGAFVMSGVGFVGELPAIADVAVAIGAGEFVSGTLGMLIGEPRPWAQELRAVIDAI